MTATVAGLRAIEPLSDALVAAEQPVLIEVPVARDGSMFLPNLRRSSGFWIGEKGAEQRVQSFQEAIALLRAMPVARWRRPNAAGNWGIVAAVEWTTVRINDHAMSDS